MMLGRTAGNFRAGAAVLCAVLPAGVAVAQGPWAWDLEAAAGTNNNIGQAEHQRDIVNDRFADLTAGGTYTQALNPTMAASARGFLETEGLRKVPDLSRVTAGIQFIGRWQPLAGPTASSYEFNVSVQADEYKHSQRDSTVTTAQLVASKPFTDRISASTGIEYRNRDSSGTVFDLDQWRWFLEGRYALPPGWTIRGAYSFIDGDVWSTAQTRLCDGTQVASIYPLVVAADAIEPDDAFNSAYCGRWLAYRLPAQTHTLTLGVSKEIDPGLTLDLSGLGVKVNAKGDNEYRTFVLRVGLSKRF